MRTTFLNPVKLNKNIIKVNTAMNNCQYMAAWNQPFLTIIIDFE